MNRKIAILTEGKSNPHVGKTARNLMLYKPEEVVAVIDSTQVGKTAQELFNSGNNIPVVASVDDVDADTLLVGIATPGGVLPPELKKIVIQAVNKGMNIISGLHEYLSDDPEITELAKVKNATIWDVRKNDEHDVVHRKNINENCFRLHTVGNDCSLGKMIVSYELSKSLNDAGCDAKFCATGQTGIVLEGEGVPIDNVIGDYINGAAEKLVLKNQHHEMILIEGQGSLVHPRYSGVTLGLLHGCQPHAMIMCYEMGRTHIHGVDGFEIPPLKKVISLYEQMASVMNYSEVIGIAVNTRKFGEDEARAEIERVSDEFNLPATDVIRFGTKPLVDAIITYKAELMG